MHHNDERALTTKEVDKELEEGINGKGLINGQTSIQEGSTSLTS